MSSPLAETMAAVVAWLTHVEARWYLFGAHAVAVHAVPRQTQDIDVTVEAPAGGISALIAGLDRFGLESRTAHPLTFARRLHVLPLVHVDTRITVDVIIAGTAAERRALSRVVDREIFGQMIPVVSAEDLVLSKLGSERERDNEDARAVVAVMADELDADYVRRGLAAKERVFDRSDLVRQFDSWLERYRRGI